MGEAKKRGTREQRIDNAARTEARRVQAPALVCNHCHQALTTVDAMDASQLPGIEIAFRAHCTACAQDTWAVRGTAPAVRAFYATLEQASGQTVALGTAARQTAA